ncbi:MAG: tyrosine-type recombinase/integrase [Candidatus Levybacteria bacterium]|nr:tyrosine-type recombinase/integrase [Candidatus Levybacteria bacterium]
MEIEQQDFVQYLTIKKKLAPKSIKAYRIRFSIIKRWLLLHNTVLSKQIVEDFLYEKKEKENLSNAAVNTYIQALKHIEGYCKDRGLSKAGFMDGIESLPKTQSEINPLTLEETERLLNTHLEYKNRNGVKCNDLDKKYLTLTAFLSITGCRFEEAASLKVKRLDIENERAFIVNTKNKHNRFIFIKGAIKQLLQDLIKEKNDEDLVFTNSKGQHIHPGDFNNDLRLRAKKAGIIKRVHAHLLRHSFATQFYKGTHDITLVATILGHRDIKTTVDTYVHLDTEFLQKSIQKHPLLRKYIEPKEILKEIKYSIDSFKIDDDDRFSYNVMITNNGLEVKIIIK